MVDFTILGSLLNDSSIDSTEDIAELASDDRWEFIPVDLETFLYGEEYLNLTMRLSAPQLEFVDNTSNIFNPPFFTESVLMAGQGSGKDTCSILIGLRIVYLLQCLKSPQAYFGMDTNGFIDSINVAQNADIARNIYFSTLSNILRSSPLFVDDSLPHYISPRITQQTVVFPKNIRLISGNSENESWQGYTPILIILDEIDAFKSEQELQRSHSLRSEGAEGVYNTAKALIQSRFPGVGKVICLSWPRFKGSFIQRRFTNGKLEDRTFVSCKEGGLPFTTWEFNPSKKESDFIDFYETDPVLARARFECFDGDTLIISEEGTKPIRDVIIGDRVLSHQGLNKVIRKFEKNYTGDILEITPWYHRPIKITPEHPILAIKQSGNWRKFYKHKLADITPTWIPANQLTKNDIVLLKIPEDCEDVKSIDLSDGLEKDSFIEEENYLWASQVSKLNNGGVSVQKHPFAHKLSKYIDVSNELLFLSGLYLAAGTLGTKLRAMTFSFDKHERSLIDNTKKLVDQVFGIFPVEYNVLTVTDVLVCNTIISHFFAQFGKRATNKRIPEWIMNLPPEKQQHLLDGYFESDGHDDIKGKGVTTVSKELAYQVKTIALRLGMPASVYHRPMASTGVMEGRTINQSPAFRTRIYKNPYYQLIKDGFWYVPVRKIQSFKYDDTVYNLEVESANSYTTESFTVHNCDPPFARDAYIKDPLPILRAFDAEVDEVGQITWGRLKEHRDESGLHIGTKYYIHVDLGLRHANAAVCVAHQGDEHVVIDVIKIWEPEPEYDVDFANIENFILGLRDKGHRIVSVTYDNYQSVSSLQKLAKFGIPAKYKSIGRSSKEAYDTFKDLLYQEKLDGFYDKETIEELLSLDVVYGDKIEARPGMKKDRADAVVGAVHGVLKEKGTVTGLRNMGGINTLFENRNNPQTTANEKAKNPLKTPTNSGWGRDAVQERIVSSSSDVCVVCNRVGGIEYTDELNNRVFDGDGAYWRMCLVCASKWVKEGTNWVICRAPDDYSMQEIIGTI